MLCPELKKKKCTQYFYKRYLDWTWILQFGKSHPYLSQEAALRT